AAITLRDLVGLPSSSSNQDGPHRSLRRDCYHCGNRDENAGVIRFDFMWPQTVNRPDSGSSSGRYFMACCNTSLPIQDDVGGIISGSDEANIEKCSRSEIRT